SPKFQTPVLDVPPATEWPPPLHICHSRPPSSGRGSAVARVHSSTTSTGVSVLMRSYNVMVTIKPDTACCHQEHRQTVLYEDFRRTRHRRGRSRAHCPFHGRGAGVRA